METLLQQILALLIQAPGSLVYHLVLAFSILSSLQSALIVRQRSSYPHSRRLVLGLMMLLAGQVVLFLCSGLAWQGILDSNILLPPLDRAVIIYSLIWVVWLWSFPAPARLGDLVTGFLNLGVVIAFLFTYTSWIALSAATPSFNQTWIDWVWELSGLFVVLTGMAVLLFSRPPGWSFGFGMLSLNLAGMVSHLLVAPAEGSFSGFLRLGLLASFPLLPTILNRITAAPAALPHKPLPAAAPQIPFPRIQERRRFSTDPRTVHAWLELNASQAPEDMLRKLTKAIGHTMLADICFLVNGPNYGHVVLVTGYDLIREEEMSGTMIDQNDLPSLANALQRAKPVRIPAAESQPPDLKTLSAALGLKEVGSLMYLPLAVGDQPQGGLLFLSPYSNREWTSDDQGYLASEIETIAGIVKNASQTNLAHQAAEQTGGDLRSQITLLQLDNQRLLEEVENLRSVEIKPGPAVQQTDLTALIALQQEAQEQISVLQSENERLQSLLRSQGVSALSHDDFSRLESELRATLQEMALLQNQLADANARNLMLERQIDHPPADTGAGDEIITSIVQEMRQPMSSILGYTDLLLAESVGILGALQRKFLERIKVSTDRMRLMLDNLIQVSAAGEGALNLIPQPVDLGTVIDSAIADASAQLREKNIALRVDLPDENLNINADRDAIQQVIIQLLHNAGSVTPHEGAISLRARTHQEDESTFLLLQVTDSGGGVPVEELPRVFARRYRAEMPLIQGLGDTGVGLAIAKTLVDAHGGRIWVDTVAGQATTFSVLLPIGPNSNHTAQE